MASVATKIIDKENKPDGKISTDNKRWEFPRLDKKNKNNRIQYWQLYVELFNVKTEKILKIKEEYFNNDDLGEDIVGRYYTISGLEDGKETQSCYTYIESGKNLGKKNQTNVLTQTLMNGRTIYNKYINKYNGFIEHNEELTLLKPMLAHIYNKKRIHFDKENIYLQPKLDGLRMLYHNDILYTRELKYYPGKEYIKKELDNIILPKDLDIKNLYLDGELYNHNLTLQEINSLGRKDSDNNNKSLEYHIYDIFTSSDKNLSFDNRLKYLEYIKKNNSFKYIKIVDTHKVESFADIEKYYDYYLKNNYEGVMLRLGHSIYEINKRSYNLLKYKPIQTEEFIIIDVEEGKGKNKNIPLFVLSASLKGFKERIDENNLKKHKDLKLFKASLKNYSVEDAKKLYKELVANNKELFFEKYYLAPAVCEFLNYSNDKIPKSCYILEFLLD
jgi:hypothetical protein